MRSGYKKGSVPADSSVKASRPERLENLPSELFSFVEVYAPQTADGVTGNTEAVWVGGEGTCAVPGEESGVDLHPGDSYSFPNTRLYDIWLAVTTDGDRVTWIARP